MRAATTRIGVAVVLLTVLAGCGNKSRPATPTSPPKPPEGEEGSPPVRYRGQAAEKGETYKTVTVFYGTTRNRLGRTAPYYGDDPSTLHYGTCDVSIPRDHTPGSQETPFVKRILGDSRFTRLFEDPNKHIVVLEELAYADLSQFFFDLSRRLKDPSADDTAFIYVHGYNVTFLNGCRQAAQFAADTGFKGAPILFSWPSHGGSAEYFADEEDMNNSVVQLEQFLWEIGQRSNARSVHIVSHSLGSRAVLAALSKLAAERKPTAPMFDQLIMAAPDIWVSSFDQYRATLSKVVRGTTLYVSRGDSALEASSRVHLRHRRLGAVAVGSSMPLFPGVDTIDASSVNFSLLGINHSYWADKLEVLRDLANVLQKVPQLRPNLEEKMVSGKTYWLIRSRP